MKLTKSQLREIIEDELRKDALQEDYEEEGEEYVLDPDAPVDELWKHLNFLLEDWEDKAHPYYEDLLNTVRDFAEEEPEVEEEYAEEEITFEPERDPVHGGIPVSGFQESIEEMVREMFQGDLEERKKKRSVKSERRTRGRSARQK